MIKVKNLTFSYSLTGGSHFKALNNICLEIAKGERVAIIGSSGAGKSTLLKCFNQLNRPCEGSIRIAGQEILALSNKGIRKTRRKIGMIFQNFDLIKRASVLDNVLTGRLAYVPLHRRYLYGFSYSRNDYEIALDCLKLVQIREFVDRRVDTLSGGQQQRVGVARALAQQPEVILADEPVSNLDPKTKCEIMNLLISICEGRRLTLVISIHEVELVKDFVSRIIGLNHGNLVFDDCPKALTEEKYAQIYC